MGMWEINRDEWLGIVNSHNSAVLSKSKLFENIPAQSRLHQNDARNPSTLQWPSIWSTVVQEYRAKNLTVPEDEIMAFTGIARAAHNIARQTYFAGLWAEDMPSCLLWRVGYQRHSAVLRRSKDLPSVVRRARCTHCRLLVTILGTHQLPSPCRLGGLQQLSLEQAVLGLPCPRPNGHLWTETKRISSAVSHA
jgi:hypothetical protein